MGKRLLANQILTWYPRAFFGSGIMEGLVAHDEPEVPAEEIGALQGRVSMELVPTLTPPEKAALATWSA